MERAYNISCKYLRFALLGLSCEEHIVWMHLLCIWVSCYWFTFKQVLCFELLGWWFCPISPACPPQVHVAFVRHLHRVRRAAKTVEQDGMNRLMPKFILEAWSHPFSAKMLSNHRWGRKREVFSEVIWRDDRMLGVGGKFTNEIFAHSLQEKECTGAS